MNYNRSVNHNLGDIMFKSHVLILSLLMSFQVFARPKVILLGMDGTGANFLSAKTSPNIYRLLKESAYSLNMQNTLPAWSATNWFSMFSSTATNEHTIKGNLQKFPKNAPLTYPQFAAQKDSSFKTLSYHSWANLNDIVGKGANISSNKLKWDDVVFDKLIETIEKDQLADFTFAYFQEVDHTGHNHLWGSKKYFRALKVLDQRIGTVIDTLRKKGILDQVYVVLSADHGGQKLFVLRSMLEHGGDRTDVRAIPFIIRGPGIKSGPIKEEVRIFDIMPTIAMVQGFKDLPSSWIGRPIETVFNNRQIQSAKTQLPIKMSTSFKVLLQNKRAQNFDAFKPISISRDRAYFPFGDVIMTKKRPNIKSVPMAPLIPGITAHPIAYEKILNNRLSVANPFDFTVFHPIGPLGYVCPGEVIIPEITTNTPNLKDYICIHQDYVSSIASERVWTSVGQLQVKYGISFWSPRKSKGDLYPLNTFYSRRHKTDKGLDRGYQLRADKVILSK